MKHECEKTEVIDMIRDDLKELKADMKSLLKFKNQFMAIALVVSTFITVTWNILLFLLTKR